MRFVGAHFASCVIVIVVSVLLLVLQVTPTCVVAYAS